MGYLMWLVATMSTLFINIGKSTDAARMLQDVGIQEITNQDNYAGCGCIKPPPGTYGEYGYGEYGSGCEVWDNTPLSPFYAWPPEEERTATSTACDADGGADYCARESWCNTQWCYVGLIGGYTHSPDFFSSNPLTEDDILRSCPDAQESTLVDGLYYSYLKCGNPNCYTMVAEGTSEERFLHELCPYDPIGRCTPGPFQTLNTESEFRRCENVIDVDSTITGREECAYASNSNAQCGEYFQTSSAQGCQCTPFGVDCGTISMNSGDSWLYQFQGLEECTAEHCSNHGSATGYLPACRCTCDIAWEGSTCQVNTGFCNDVWDCGNQGQATEPDRIRPPLSSTAVDYCDCNCHGSFSGESCQNSPVANGGPWQGLSRLNEAACNRHGIPRGFGSDYTCRCDGCWEGTTCDVLSTNNCCSDDSDCNFANGDWCHSSGVCQQYSPHYCESNECKEGDGDCDWNECDVGFFCGYNNWQDVHPAVVGPSSNNDACKEAIGCSSDDQCTGQKEYCSSFGMCTIYHADFCSAIVCGFGDGDCDSSECGENLVCGVNNFNTHHPDVDGVSNNAEVCVECTSLSDCPNDGEFCCLDGGYCNILTEYQRCLPTVVDNHDRCVGLSECEACVHVSNMNSQWEEEAQGKCIMDTKFQELFCASEMHHGYDECSREGWQAASTIFDITQSPPQLILVALAWVGLVATFYALFVLIKSGCKKEYKKIGSLHEDEI